MTTIEGSVVTSQSRWSDGRIITESVIRQTDGHEVRVFQAGGTVDGIGMVQFPGQPLLEPGYLVSVEVPLLDAGIPVTKAAIGPLPVLAVIALAQPATAPDGPEILKGTNWHPPPGYVRTTNKYDAPLYWSSGCVFIIYDSAGTAQIAGDQEFAVMDGVFAQWRQSTQSCSYLTFEISGRESMEVGYDGKNIIKFRDTRWCKPAAGDEPEVCYGRDAAAITTLHFVNDPDSERNGEILDGDIEMNGQYFAISTGGASEGMGQCLSDLANTLTHEVGHLMGLEHTCRTFSDPERVDNDGNAVPLCALDQQLPASIREATMFNFQDCGETIKSTPEADDIAGVCGIYPAQADPGTCSPAQLKKGGCAVSAGGSNPAPALPWLALALGLGLFCLRRRQS